MRTEWRVVVDDENDTVVQLIDPHGHTTILFTNLSTIKGRTDFGRFSLKRLWTDGPIELTLEVGGNR